MLTLFQKSLLGTIALAGLLLALVIAAKTPAQATTISPAVQVPIGLVPPGIVTTGDATIRVKPDAAIVNFSIDGSVGLESIEVLKSNHPELPVIASVLHNEEALVEKAIKVGAQGYITGSVGAEGFSTDRDVIESVRRVLAAP